MRERLIEMIQNSVGGCARHWAEIIADNLLANEVIVPPCKVGDTIFVIRNDIIEQETVRGIKIGNCGLYLQVSRGFDDFEYHYDIEIGNKLFFEKEEAEAKMKGGAE